MLKCKWSGICIAVAGILSMSISCRQAAPASEEAAEVITPVTIAPVEFRTMKSTVDLPAVSSFLRKGSIRSTVTGTIQKAYVSQGESVSAGQLLFSVRTRESVALANSKGSDTTLAFKGLIEIKSAGKGVIISIKYQPGDFVQEGDEMAAVSEKNSLAFILEVPVEFDSYVAKNRNCNIVLPDETSIKGTITGKLPEMDLQSQTIKYIIKPVKDESFPEYLIANVSLVTAEKDNALVLPRKAVLSNETQDEFWVMKLLNDSVAVKTVVEKGLENDEDIEITKPMFLPSDRIIITGNYGLPDTARISITAN
jgi:biotin carboxyl carrier protein